MRLFFCYYSLMKPKHFRVLFNSIMLFLIAALTLIAARIGGGNGNIGYFLNNLEISVFILLLSFWGISIQRRITVSNIRHDLLNALGFMFIWFFSRCLKFHAYSEYSLMWCICWYGYYLCEVGIVLHAYFISLYIGRHHRTNIALRRGAAVVTAAVLMVLIYTNNIHEWALRVKPLSTAPEHGPVYYMTVIYILVLTFFSLLNIYKAYDERKIRRKMFWPLFVLFLGIVYLVFYYTDIPFFKTFEFTITTIALTVVVFESLIQTGLIPSNSEYEWCLENSSLKVQIADTDINVHLKSKNVHKLDKELFAHLKSHNPVKADDDTEMFIADIPGGYVTWERDISEENEILDALNDTREGIEAANKVLRDNIRAEGMKYELSERNRLYDLIINRIDYKIDELREGLEKLKSADKTDAMRLIGDINVKGVYIKRKSNLILVEEMKTGDLGRELKLCFKETFDNLKKCGLKADFMCREIPVIGIDIALIVYDLLETFIERRTDETQGIIAIVADSGKELTLTVNMTFLRTPVDISVFEAAFDKWNELVSDNYGGSLTVEADGMERSIFVTLKKGGALT